MELRVTGWDIIIVLGVLTFVGIRIMSHFHRLKNTIEIDEIEEPVVYKPHKRTDFPYTLDEFVGQKKIISMLKVKLKVCKERNQILSHTLLYGMPGLGKTTISELIAQELNRPFISIEGITIDSRELLLKLVMSITDGTVVFIDEIHQVKRQTAEVLFKIMENFTIDYEEDGIFITYTIPTFTLIGATTDPGLLQKPMRDRFINQYHLSPYNEIDLYSIINRLAKIEPEASMRLAYISQKTPRLAKNYLVTLNDFMYYEGVEAITQKHVKQLMYYYEINKAGLVRNQVDLLGLLKEADRPIGKTALATALGVSQYDLEQMVEPYLIQERLILLTPRGRIISDKGKSIIN